MVDYEAGILIIINLLKYRYLVLHKYECCYSQIFILGVSL